MVGTTQQSPDEASPSPTAGLAIDGVALVRGMRVIQPGVSHAIAPGGITLLTGPNGSGKSTLLRTIAGRLRPMAGTMTCDVPILYVGHADGLADGLSGRRNLIDWAGLNGLRSDGAMIDDALAALAAGSFAELPVRLLSRGQRRRLALARLALSPAGALWLLDEPAAGLDQAAQAALGQLIAAHLDTGGMVMAATHTPLGTGHAPTELVLEAQP
jgi:heme exporter protein A